MNLKQKGITRRVANIYNVVLKTAIMPLLDLEGQTYHVKCLNFLEKSQWLSPAQLQELQNKRLRALLKYAYETVPFYRRRFKDVKLKPEAIQNVQQLAKLPRLTKEEIRRNLRELVSTQTPKSKLTLFATGGSTGEPLKFFKDKRTISWAYAATSRNYRWANLDLGEKYLILWGSPFDVSVSSEFRGILHERLMRYRILPCTQMSESSMGQYVQKIRRYRPKALKGYTSALVLFARYLKEHRIGNLNIRSIISTAETLFPADRKLIEEQFDCAVYDTYGSREIALMAGECEEHHGLHISAETVVLEFVKNNENVAAGELGEILVTDLQNYGMPLIRYSNGDAGRPSDDICSCGRGLPLIKSIDGRVTDFVRAGDGRRVPGPVFTLLFGELPVKKYQIVQTAFNKLTVKVVKDAGYSADDDRKIVSRLATIVGEKVEINIEYVADIPPSSRSGKFLPVVSRIPAFESHE